MTYRYVALDPPRVPFCGSPPSRHQRPPKQVLRSNVAGGDADADADGSEGKKDNGTAAAAAAMARLVMRREAGQQVMINVPLQAQTKCSMQGEKALLVACFTPEGPATYLIKVSQGVDVDGAGGRACPPARRVTPAPRHAARDFRRRVLFCYVQPSKYVLECWRMQRIAQDFFTTPCGEIKPLGSQQKLWPRVWGASVGGRATACIPHSVDLRLTSLSAYLMHPPFR